MALICLCPLAGVSSHPTRTLITRRVQTEAATLRAQMLEGVVDDAEGTAKRIRGLEDALAAAEAENRDLRAKASGLDADLGFADMSQADKSAEVDELRRANSELRLDRARLVRQTNALCVCVCVCVCVCALRCPSR